MRFGSFLPDLPRPIVGALLGGVAAFVVIVACWLLLSRREPAADQVANSVDNPAQVATDAGNIPTDAAGNAGTNSATRGSTAGKKGETAVSGKAVAANKMVGPATGPAADPAAGDGTAAVPGQTAAAGKTGAAGKTAAAGNTAAADGSASDGKSADDDGMGKNATPGNSSTHGGKAGGMAGAAADVPTTGDPGAGGELAGTDEPSKSGAGVPRRGAARRFEPIEPAPSLTLIQAAIWWCLVLWLLAVGGCFGSFMNVVIYRLPAGLSLLRPASRCPYCLEGIRGSDNVPVLSWLWLRGRCRTCGGMIAARYPAIEALVAVGCVALALVEVFPEGQGLPTEVQQDLRENPWQLWTMFAGHLMLLCTLVCAAAIQIDGHPVPLRLFIPLALTAVVLATMVPEACRLRWSVSAAGTLSGNLIQAMMAAGCGAFAGASLALATRESDRVSRGTLTMAIILALVTLFLGWITGIVVAIASGLLTAVRDRLARRYTRLDEVPTVAIVTAVTFGLLLTWRWLLPHFPLLALDSASSFAVATIVAALLLSAAAWWLGPWSPLNWPERGDTIEIIEGQYRRTEYGRRRGSPPGDDPEDRDEPRPNRTRKRRSGAASDRVRDAEDTDARLDGDPDVDDPWEERHNADRPGRRGKDASPEDGDDDPTDTRERWRG